MAAEPSVFNPHELFAPDQRLGNRRQPEGYIWGKTLPASHTLSIRFSMKCGKVISKTMGAVPLITQSRKRSDGIDQASLDAGLRLTSKTPPAIEMGS